MVCHSLLLGDRALLATGAEGSGPIGAALLSSGVPELSLMPSYCIPPHRVLSCSHNHLLPLHLQPGAHPSMVCRMLGRNGMDSCALDSLSTLASCKPSTVPPRLPAYHTRGLTILVSAWTVSPLWSLTSTTEVWILQHRHPLSSTMEEQPSTMSVQCGIGGQVGQCRSRHAWPAWAGWGPAIYSCSCLLPLHIVGQPTEPAADGAHWTTAADGMTGRCLQ